MAMLFQNVAAADLLHYVFMGRNLDPAISHTVHDLALRVLCSNLDEATLWEWVTGFDDDDIDYLCYLVRELLDSSVDTTNPIV